MGPTAARRQREVEEREARILEVARGILIERGYSGLTMDRVVEATEYSKGTLYRHFSSREDLLAALAAQSLQKRVELFRRAATFAGRPRERYLAVGVAAEIFFLLYPSYGRSEQILMAEPIQAKLSAERAEAMRMCLSSCQAVADGILRDAIAQGDLVLPAGMPAEEITLMIRCLYTGVFQLLQSGAELVELGIPIPDPLRSLRRHAHFLLDGLGWRPLSSVWDYEETRRRVLERVFPAEAAELPRAPRPEGARP